MNRRQAKKAYKKKHGHNPPKTERRYHSTRYTRQVARAVNDIYFWIVEWFDTIMRSALTTVKKIQTMPQEEFDKTLNEHLELTPHDRALALYIRSGGKRRD